MGDARETSGVMERLLAKGAEKREQQKLEQYKSDLLGIGKIERQDLVQQRQQGNQVRMLDGVENTGASRSALMVAICCSVQLHHDREI